ncbi:UNVERIFIED_ORG: hypothetical protein J2806_004150 [Kosakonia oryzae]|nr:hypothetical protein [Kosakonia oryzae]
MNNGENNVVVIADDVDINEMLFRPARQAL